MITCFGDVIQDILIRPAGALQRGSDTPGQILQRGGGSAANTACWLGKAGADVCFIGQIGKDPAGDFLQQGFVECGVEPRLSRAEEPTGVIAVLIDDEGQRTMITQRGANLTFSEQTLRRHLPQHSRWMHITGYSFFQSVPLHGAAEQFLAHAGSIGAAVSLDPSSYALLQRYGAKRFLEITSGAHLFLPNQDEAAVLTGCRHPEAAAETLLLFYDAVIVTLGPEGCFWAEGTASGRVAAAAEMVEDSTGAGDAFNAGVLSALDAGASLADAAACGQDLAARCCAVMGARPDPQRQGRGTENN